MKKFPRNENWLYTRFMFCEICVVSDVLTETYLNSLRSSNAYMRR